MHVKSISLLYRVCHASFCQLRILFDIVNKLYLLFEVQGPKTNACLKELNREFCRSRSKSTGYGCKDYKRGREYFTNQPDL